MTAINDDTGSPDGLTLLLGPRQADIMRLLWAQGPATVSTLHQHLHAAHGLAYTTVLTLCVRLFEKGLLDRYRADPAMLRARGYAYVYAPRMGADDFVRAAVEQQLDTLLAHYPALVCAHVARHTAPAQPPADRTAIEVLLASLGALRDVDGQPADAAALDAIESLLERAEAAERQAATWAMQARRAEQRAAAAERRPQRQAPATKRRRIDLSELDHQDPAGVCRVCGQPAPPARSSRKDGLRVCGQVACRAEARRRDSIVKQRQTRLRRRTRNDQPVASPVN